MKTKESLTLLKKACINMNKLYIMVGLPGSGKSTIAKECELENKIIISSDDIRAEISNVNDQTKNKEVFEILNLRVKMNLAKGKNVIFDATNINYKKRMEIIKNNKEYFCECIFVATPYEECLKRNSNRERKVPEKVIEKMYKNFYVPQAFEGFKRIIVIYPDRAKEKVTFASLKDIEQDNKYHQYTVKEHCNKVYQYMKQKTKNKNLILASRLHDIGKLKTKTFVNTKGEITDQAHFYGHENVGAYDSLFFKKTDRLDVAKYIQWHMLLKNNLSEKRMMHYKNLLGEKFMDDLKLLNEADNTCK